MKNCSSTLSEKDIARDSGLCPTRLNDQPSDPDGTIEFGPPRMAKSSAFGPAGKIMVAPLNQDTRVDVETSTPKGSFIFPAVNNSRSRPQNVYT